MSKVIINLSGDSEDSLYWGEKGSTYHKPSAIRYPTRSSAKRIYKKHLEGTYPNAKQELVYK